MSVSGYPKQGNLILGKVISFQSKKLVLDKEGLPIQPWVSKMAVGFMILVEPLTLITCMNFIQKRVAIISPTLILKEGLSLIHI